MNGDFPSFFVCLPEGISLYLMVKAMVSCSLSSQAILLWWVRLDVIGLKGDLKLDTQTVWPYKMGSWTVISPKKIVDSFSDLLVIYTILLTVCSTIRIEGMMFPLHSHYILMVSTIRSYIATNKNRSCQTDDPQFLSILNDSWTKPQIKRNHVAFVASSSIFPVPKSPHFPMISPIIPISPIFPSFFSIVSSFLHHFVMVKMSGRF